MKDIRFNSKLQDLADETLKVAALAKVRQQSKAAAAATCALISDVQVCKSEVDDPTSLMGLLQASSSAQQAISELVKCLKAASVDATDANLQQKLVLMAQTASNPCNEFFWIKNIKNIKVWALL